VHGLAEQPAVAQRIADALRGDRVLEVPGVAGMDLLWRGLGRAS
jgi:hypothetical protein